MMVKDFKPYQPTVQLQREKLIKDMVDRFVEQSPMHHICVVDENGKLQGMINRKRIFQTVFSHHVSADSRVTHLYNLLTAEKAGELMISDVITVNENDNINAVIKKMIEHDLFEIPVVDEDKRVLGFLTSGQILKKLAKEQGF
jgi:CBS-domain-containing membrane protein